MESPSLRFAATVRTIGQAARACGLVAPAFRSPPGIAGADRTVRRRRDGGVTVAVVVRGRPSQAVVADLIEGVIVANRLTGAEATRVRTRLWEAVVGVAEQAA